MNLNINIDMNIENKLHNYLSSQGLISNKTTWQIQTGGQTNKVWRLIGDEDLICKLYLNTNSNPLFQNIPFDEYKCLSKLKGKGITPDLFDFLNTPVGEVLLYHYIDGNIWSYNVEAVSELLNKIHILCPPQELRVLSGIPADIKNHGLNILNNLSGFYKNKLLKICPNVTFTEFNPALVHTDVVVGNLIQGRDSLRLIDWQCPAIGDPIIDIVMFLSPAMHKIYGSRSLSQNEHKIFLSSLEDKLRERYNKLGPLYHWRLAAYCLWKFEQGSKQYKEAALEEIKLLEGV